MLIILTHCWTVLCQLSSSLSEMTGAFDITQNNDIVFFRKSNILNFLKIQAKKNCSVWTALNTWSLALLCLWHEGTLVVSEPWVFSVITEYHVVLYI